MDINSTCPVTILKYIKKALRTKDKVSFNDVIGASECKKYTVKEIGTALELIRRHKLVTATSKFGCSELLEFCATSVTEEGEAFLRSNK